MDKGKGEVPRIGKKVRGPKELWAKQHKGEETGGKKDSQGTGEFDHTETMPGEGLYTEIPPDRMPRV